MLILICGMIGSGKTTLASELGHRLATPVVHLDHFKREIVEANPWILDRLKNGEEVPREYLEQVLDMAANELEKLSASHQICIAEEVFAREDDCLELIRRCARFFGGSSMVINTTASPEVLRQRLIRRQGTGAHLVDVQYYDTMRKRFGQRHLVQINYSTDLPESLQTELFEDLVRFMGCSLFRAVDSLEADRMSDGLRALQRTHP